MSIIAGMINFFSGLSAIGSIASVLVLLASPAAAGDQPAELQAAYEACGRHVDFWLTPDGRQVRWDYEPRWRERCHAIETAIDARAAARDQAAEAADDALVTRAARKYGPHR